MIPPLKGAHSVQWSLPGWAPEIGERRQARACTHKWRPLCEGHIAIHRAPASCRVSPLLALEIALFRPQIDADRAQFCHCGADHRINFRPSLKRCSETSLHGLHRKSHFRSPPSAAGITCSSERASCPRQIMHLSPSQGTFIESLLFRRAREHPAPASMTRTCNIMRIAAPFRERPPSRPGSVRIIVTAQAVIANRRSP